MFLRSHSASVLQTSDLRHFAPTSISDLRLLQVGCSFYFVNSTYAVTEDLVSMWLTMLIRISSRSRCTQICKIVGRMHILLQVGCTNFCRSNAHFLCVCIQPTVKWATDIQQVGYTNFFQLSVYPTYRSSDQQQLEAAEKPRAGRSEISQDGCNVGRM